MLVFYNLIIYCIRYLPFFFSFAWGRDVVCSMNTILFLQFPLFFSYISEITWKCHNSQIQWGTDSLTSRQTKHYDIPASFVSTSSFCVPNLTISSTNIFPSVYDKKNAKYSSHFGSWTNFEIKMSDHPYYCKANTSLGITINQQVRRYRTIKF